ncbi:MAG: adenosylhomocysteinase [Candidatus Mycalebacterium zealandia]|nr:MAG: adenosylhomocysteinase [Candidatus Mycalebacterium zealandia]
MENDIKDIKLATEGKLRAEWAAQQMPVLGAIETEFLRTKPLKGIRVAACLHVTTETGNLMTTLKAGGAQVSLCASNPLSTQDDVAAYLVKRGIPTFAVKGESTATFHKHLKAVLAMKPHVTMDDGADITAEIHKSKSDNYNNIIGGTEETTTGVIRLKSLAAQNKLKYPIFAVNDAKTKHFFDNRYGTGQSTLDGIIRATNRLISGTSFVVAGYGWCGKGLAMRARGMGANVIVTEIDPIKGLEAKMDGFNVMPMSEASPLGDFFCTVTGNLNVIRKEHFVKMKTGAIVCNSGHFDAEIDLKKLASITKSTRVIREYIEEHTLKNGRKVNILGQGRLVNLAAAEGHPSSVMDMSFANQALSCEYLVKKGRNLKPDVYGVPEKLDARIASIKLKALGINIDKLTSEQRKYLNSWEVGT